MQLPMPPISVVQPPPGITVSGVIGYDVLARSLLVLPSASSIRGISDASDRCNVKIAGLPLRPLPEESTIQWHPLIIVS